MFFSLVLLRPHRATLPLIMLCHLLFHGFTFLAMAKRIGFVFPAAMLCSELLLVPLDDGGDANLVAWVGRVLTGAPSARVGGGSAAGRVRRALFGLYLLMQLGLPARMPLVSGLEFPRNALGCRVSPKPGPTPNPHSHPYPDPTLTQPLTLAPNPYPNQVPLQLDHDATRHHALHRVRGTEGLALTKRANGMGQPGRPGARHVATRHHGRPIDALLRAHV